MTSQLTPYVFDGAAGVYAVRRDDTGLVKVGVTGNIKQRLRSLAPIDGRKEPLTLIAFIPGAQLRDERAIHERLACCHVHGEWFSDEALVLKVFDGWTVIPSTDEVRTLLMSPTGRELHQAVVAARKVGAA